jgi:hypothetical protein
MLHVAVRLVWLTVLVQVLVSVFPGDGLGWLHHHLEELKLNSKHFRQICHVSELLHQPQNDSRYEYNLVQLR